MFIIFKCSIVVTIIFRILFFLFFLPISSISFFYRLFSLKNGSHHTHTQSLFGETKSIANRVQTEKKFRIDRSVFDTHTQPHTIISHHIYMWCVFFFHSATRNTDHYRDWKDIDRLTRIRPARVKKKHSLSSRFWPFVVVVDSLCFSFILCMCIFFILPPKIWLTGWL